MRKSNTSLLILTLLLPAQVALAQNNPAPAQPPANPQPSAGAPATTTSVSVPNTDVDSSTSTALDYLFNHKPGEGTAGKAGSEVAGALADRIKAVDVLKTPGLDDPEIRARFETYLSLKEVSDARIKEYFGKMADVTDTLKQGDAFGAWKILYALGEYKDLDAGISRELAHRVEAIWNNDRAKSGLEMANDTLKNNIETYNHNADMIADDLHDQEIEDALKLKGATAPNSQSSQNNSSSSTTNSPLTNPNVDPEAAEAAMMPTMGSALQQKMELTDEYLKMLEARAKIKMNEMRENKMSDQVRSDFADYIRTLYRSHRYYHVIIAADFYRALFNPADYPEDVVNQVAANVGVNNRTPENISSQVGSAMGVSHDAAAMATDQPTSIADEVTSALEINNQVNQSIEVFKYKADKGDIASAADELQQAFVGNEFHPGLQGLPRAEKEKVGDFLTKLDVLKNQLEVRDFEQVEAQVADIKKIAADFDPTKPMALVNGIKLESRLRLGKARLLAQGGRLTEAMQEFQTAAEEWPGNPDLQTSASGFFNTEDLQNQSTSEFDRLVQEQNYRAIFDKQLAFAPAIKGDATREQQLKDAITKVSKAEMAEQKANLMMMNGDVDGAWETVEMATKDWPDDLELNKLLASLSGRSADFVSALDKARDAESKKELGYSLTWYVNAQGYYPASVLANEGIERVKKQILSPETSPSEAN